MNSTRFINSHFCTEERSKLFGIVRIADFPLDQSNQDPDRLIKWEVDYPDNPEQFTPFLSTEMRVDETGTVHHRYYRKEQDKGITLYSLSHHPTSVKEECVKNFYKTAERTSSGPSELTHSLNLVDELLLKMGTRTQGQQQ